MARRTDDGAASGLILYRVGNTFRLQRGRGFQILYPGREGMWVLREVVLSGVGTTRLMGLEEASRVLQVWFRESRERYVCQLYPPAWRRGRLRDFRLHPGRAFLEMSLRSGNMVMSGGD